jgi:predicted dehydrogenase/threonine dehydrogenase-like Zn-dependent dehydrogenase
MKQALIKKGIAYPVELPEPTVKKGFIKIKVHYSSISAGTEMSGVTESRKSLLKKALDNPRKITAAIEYYKERGLKKTNSKLITIAEQYQESGYSVSGEVVEVGEGIANFKKGDLVSAGGMRMAVHAEYVVVPKNLVIKVPDGLDTLYASTGTVGSIALHGVRRADLKLGEYGVVLGAGLLGLLAAQMLKTSGVRVACIDLNEKRLSLAREMGVELAINPSKEDPVNAVKNWSSSYGADVVLFTAATASSEPLSQAFQMTRKKGKVVLVGVSGMEINRKDMYSDEIDFLISTSYGPGRYDDNYELKGQDYPYHYVRWTENRNIGEFLRLIRDGYINFDFLKPKIYKFEEIEIAFRDLEADPDNCILSIVEYDVSKETKEKENHAFRSGIKSGIKDGIINVGLIGAGGYAAGTLLPIIHELSDKYRLHTIVNRGGKKALDLKNRFNALHASSDIEDLTKNPEIDLIIITTQHANHAELVLRCLQAGKHVFVEKPLATTQEQLDSLKFFFTKDPEIEKPMLMVGFNRRFSLYIQEIKKHVEKRVNPLFMHYRMNAGYAPADSWVHEDGGRIVGEACHLIDLMLFLTGSYITEINVNGLKPVNNTFSRTDNKSFSLQFKDGSLAVIDYFAVGSKELPKEMLEVHYDMKSIIMNDFKSLEGYGIKVKRINSKISRKGQTEEMIALYDAMVNAKKWPISWTELVQTTETSVIINSL